MKIRYFCDVCGKEWTSAADASACERNHAIENKRDALKKKSADTLSRLYDKHIKEFHELPDITLTEEVLEIVNDILDKKLEGILGHVLTNFGECDWFSDKDKEEKH